MSYAELLVVSPLMKEKEESWSERELAAVEALGSKVYPYLLDKLLNNDCAHRGRRYCDQANALLGG